MSNGPIMLQKKNLKGNSLVQTWVKFTETASDSTLPLFLQVEIERVSLNIENYDFYKVCFLGTGLYKFAKIYKYL